MPAHPEQDHQTHPELADFPSLLCSFSFVMEQEMKIQVQISCVGQSTNPKLAIPDRVLQLVLPPAKEALHVLEEHLGPLPRG